jgi:acetoin:2,6-dichlorophenolindophenol oxidoreductase subunit beta
MPWSRFDQSHESPASGGRVISFKDAIREAIDQAMIHDPRVFAIGLDADDKFGVFGSMLNLTHPERIIGTPIAENAVTGVALGAALNGLRPICIHLRVDFLLLAMDQLVNYIANWRYMTRGKVKVPLVIRAVIGRGWGCGAQHSHTLGGFFAHIPGLKVIMPSDPYEVKGLFLAAIKDDWPVVFIEHRWLYKNTGPVPEEMYVLPLGKGRVVHAGHKLTVVATSLAVPDTLNAIARHNLDVEVIDPRCLKPLDEELILASVRKTGRLLVVDYDFPACGFAAEVCALVAEKAASHLKRPVQRLTFPDCPMPASGVLEKVYYPNPDTIAARIQSMLNEKPV